MSRDMGKENSSLFQIDISDDDIYEAMKEIPGYLDVTDLPPGLPFFAELLGILEDVTRNPGNWINWIPAFAGMTA